MNKFFKYGLIGFGGIFAAYFSYDLIDTLKKDSIRAAELVKTNAENDRIEADQFKLAESFAACAASSLKPQYLQEFIVYQVMPLGIAWQLATQRATDHPLDLTQDFTPDRLLNDHFRRTLSFAVQAEYEKNSSLKQEHFRNLANGIESKFNPSSYVRYPSIFVYESTKATSLKNTKPSDIEIGSMDFRWPKFRALALRCKATPYDLDQLTRNQNLLPEHKTEDEVETARVSSMEYGFHNHLYLKQKRMYWKSLTLTPEYKVAYAKIKAKNLSIMNAIVAEHEPRELEKKKIQKEANDVIFKAL